MGQITANAMVWAGFKSAGGLKTSIYTCCGYAAVVLGILFMSIAVDRGRNNDVFEGAARILLGAQIAIGGLFVCFNIVNTIQKDTTSKMLESHRLMPIEPRLAVLGYMFGSASPVALMMVLNFVIGGMAAGIAGMPLEWWVAANVVVLTFCIFMWSVAAGAGFYGALASGAAAVPIAILMLSGGAAGEVLPSVLMLISPVLGPSVFEGKTPTSHAMMLWATSSGLQLGIGLVFVEIGARRFRSPDLPPLTIGHGLLLLGILAIGGAIAINFDHLAVNIRRPSPQPMAAGTSVLLLLVSLAVIVSTAASDRLSRPRSLKTVFDPNSLALIVALMVMAVGFAVFVPQASELHMRVLWTAVATLCATFMFQLWAKWFYQVGGGLAGLTFVALVIGFIPLLASLLFLDPIRGELSEVGRLVSQVSPLSVMAAIWARPSPTVQPAAFLIQLLIAVGAALLIRRRSGALAPMLKASRAA